ncbi:molybdate ABC transporter substrate-binding protein [Anoxybacter fermentans]|uniref:Molybdate ABC transporter substrate-binding protein n=1 Tax=Anoxybacter fermentans TaxID=1323375 RepID=A0A3Q9HNJ4_9FIRM|nr:molybdate ABC transporter substrate-binding protein [Anoxybacter fermentans]AZR72110.1 molybdate ABC transporter substrate-binding protein [Anoxybacter fermentans]
MVNKWLIFLVIILLLIGVGLTYSHQSGIKSKERELLVFAAASLTDAFQELVEKFEQQYQGVKVRLNLASSGTLQIQIEQGAPADVFASAGIKQMESLLKKGLIATDSVTYFARNQLVVIGKKNSPLKITGPDDFLKAHIREISIGDPVTAPVGQYSVTSLKNLHIWEQIEKKLVFARNVRQVLQYVERGEVDLGFVYATDAAISEEVKVLYTIPQDTHHPILYPIGIVKESKNQDLAKKFIEWVLSPNGQEILARYGFESTI